MFQTWPFTGGFLSGLGILSPPEKSLDSHDFYSEDFVQWLASCMHKPVSVPAHRLANSVPLCGAKYVVSMLDIGPKDTWLGLDVQAVAVKWAPNMSAEEERTLRHEYAVLCYLDRVLGGGADHRSIVKVLAWGNVHHGDALLLERLVGPNLRTPLNSERLCAGQWFPRPHLRLHYTLSWAVQMARAVALMHAAGVLHGDIKPENFVFREVPDNCSPGKLVAIDFGASSIVGAGEHRATCQKKGTLPYSSPEHVLSFEIYQDSLAAPGLVNPEEEEDEEALTVLDELTSCLEFEHVSSALGSGELEREALNRAIKDGKSDVWSFGIMLRELFDTTGDFCLFEDFSPTEVINEMNKNCVPLVTVPDSLFDSMVSDVRTVIFLKSVLTETPEPAAVIETHAAVSRWISTADMASLRLVRLLRRCLRRRAEARPDMHEVWRELQAVSDVVRAALVDCEVILLEAP